MKALIKARNPEGTEEVCAGPLWHGGCPLTPMGQPVACADHEIVAIGAEGIVLAALTVERDAGVCPLAALTLRANAEGPVPPAASTTAHREL